jgi:hypothetical protein
LNYSGDFGGLFGLFLGGSAISLFEVIDLLVHITIIHVADRYAKCRQIKPSGMVNVRCVSEGELPSGHCAPTLGEKCFSDEYTVSLPFVLFQKAHHFSLPSRQSLMPS